MNITTNLHDDKWLHIQITMLKENGLRFLLDKGSWTFSKKCLIDLQHGNCSFPVKTIHLKTLLKNFGIEISPCSISLF